VDVRSVCWNEKPSFKDTHSRGVVEMEMALLDTLAVNTLRVGQTEKTLLEEGTGSYVRRRKW
jgi:hypothetical protein